MSKAKSKQAVKKGQKSDLSPQEAAYKEIVRAINKYNALYVTRQNRQLKLTTEYEENIKGAKALSYGEQYANDIALISLRETFGFAEERAKRYHDTYIKNYKAFNELENRDRSEDGDDMWYSKEKLERQLKEVCGKYYQPYEKRYSYSNLENGKFTEPEVLEKPVYFTALEVT